MLLTGCGTTIKKQPVQVLTKYKRVDIVCPDAPTLVSPNWKNIVWVVATDETGLKVLGITERNYKNLAENTQHALKAIQDRNLILNYYKKCIQEFNSNE